MAEHIMAREVLLEHSALAGQRRLGYSATGGHCRAVCITASTQTVSCLISLDQAIAFVHDHFTGARNATGTPILRMSGEPGSSFAE